MEDDFDFVGMLKVSLPTLVLSPTHSDLTSLLCSHTHVALPNSHGTLSATPVDHKSVGQARSVVLTNARLSHAHSSLHFVWPNVSAV
jgi:hypothetical protein